MWALIINKKALTSPKQAWKRKNVNYSWWFPNLNLLYTYSWNDCFILSFSVTFWWTKSCNLEGDWTLESWTKNPTGYLLPAIQPLWQVPNVLRGRGGWWKVYCEAFLAHTNLLQEDRYTPFTTEKQRIQYFYQRPGINKIPPTWWGLPNFCFNWYVYQRFPCQVFMMTRLNGTWNLASHSLQELPTEPIGIWHTMWPINVRKLTKNGTGFFSTHGGVSVVKMKMVVFLASLKSGSFEKSGISGMASWHVYAGLILWKKHRS